MSDASIVALRKHLREKFPAAHRMDKAVAPPVATSEENLKSTELQPSSFQDDPLHSLAPDRFPAGAITEITPAHPSCGLSLILAALLECGSCTDSLPLVLIDARDSFDPTSYTSAECSRLLWIRCHETDHAIKSADLLLRDGNLPFVLLDLSALPLRELRRIPTSSWHRLRQLAESTSCTLLALTPTPLIPGTALRLTLNRELTLDLLDRPRSELLDNLRVQTTRHRSGVRSA